MRSRTSFFNHTLFWKSITRFWPIWCVYFLIWFLILPMRFLREAGWSGVSAAEAQNLVYGSARIGGVALGAVFGVLAAMAVWSFLYSARSAHGCACLPLRRENLFCTLVCAGFAPILAANLLIALLSLPAGAAAGWTEPLALLKWFAIVSLIGFFFYCFATLCAQLTGNILVLLPLYAVLNFVVAGVQLLLSVVFSRFVYGMDGGSAILGGPAEYLSPVVGYVSGTHVRTVTAGTMDSYRVVGYVFEGWDWLLAYAGAGLVLLFLSLLLLRRRKMETAGDVVAVQWLKPVFRWCMGVGMALSLSSLMYYIIYQDRQETPRAAFLTTLLWVLLGAVIGWLIAEMLIRRSFRVFKGGKQWAGLGVCCLVLLAAMLGMRFDLFGYERYIPKAGDVERVYLFVRGEDAAFETAEGIAAAQALHRHIIDDKALNTDPDGYHCGVDVRYFLKNGDSVTRSYSLTYDQDQPESRGEMAELQALVNSPEAIAHRKQTAFPYTAENIQSLSVSATLSAAEWASLAGYDDPEDYILRELAGYSPAELETMDPVSRTSRALETVERYGDMYGVYPDGGVDWSRIYFSWEHALDVSPAERYAFYRDCILPDLEEGALGTVWLIQNEDYRRTVYDATIYIHARRPARQAQSTDWDAPASDGYEYDYFYTVPTVNARRTLQWLSDHGIVIHTFAERT